MTSNFSILKRKIAKKEAVVAVIGLGYVGLPLAAEFAVKGFKVTGIDLDAGRVARLKKNTSYIADVPHKVISRVTGRGLLRASTDFSLLSGADVILICVPTPLKRKYHPDISFIISAVRQIRKFLRPGQLVILESTTYPGTTEEVILPLLQSSGLACGKDFFLVFSPERIDPGNKKFPVNKIPKVVGGVTEEASELAASLYRHITCKAVRVSSPRVAETVKLLENTFRIVNIGLIDEMAMMCHRMGINIWEVVGAAKTKPFGFMPFYPGPGVGGHCIPKDPLYLYWKAKSFGFRSKYIKLSSDIINHMPHYVVERVQASLRPRGARLEKAKVLVCGVTYKKDIKDLRKSPPLDIIEILQAKGASVSYYDPLVPFLKIGNIDLRSQPLTPAGLRSCDCVIIATDHSSVDYRLIARHAGFIFDTRNVYSASPQGKIEKL
ncbi:MAG: nucleotide sugar dehydrogenase [Candidatus Omnitrophota bacterium]|jgi:UDP-N-acetyl-D-glucosamine dehydrogenase